MGGSYFNNAALFLVQAVFGFYILAVLLRLILQWARADFYNQISQFLVKITNPALVPLRRFIPSAGGIDTASIVLLLVLQLTELVLTGLLSTNQSLHIGGLLVLSFARLLELLVNVFFYGILIRVILSWLRPSDNNPFSDLLYSVTEPLLGPARRMLPDLGGLDLSPIVVLIALRMVSFLAVAPLTDLGLRLLA